MNTSGIIRLKQSVQPLKFIRVLTIDGKKILKKTTVAAVVKIKSHQKKNAPLFALRRNIRTGTVVVSLTILKSMLKPFIGKTKVAEIMKAHGLSHPFERKPAKVIIPPEDMLLHEPWKRNLVWGMDWTWVTVNGKFMFLLVLLDCTSSNLPTFLF
jgi:hypothetical protein